MHLIDFVFSTHQIVFSAWLVEIFRTLSWPVRYDWKQQHSIAIYIIIHFKNSASPRSVNSIFVYISRFVRAILFIFIFNPPNITPCICARQLVSFYAQSAFAARAWRMPSSMRALVFAWRVVRVVVGGDFGNSIRWKFLYYKHRLYFCSIIHVVCAGGCFTYALCI